MTKVDLAIQLQGRSAEAGIPVFETGDSLQGSLVVTLSEELRCQHLLVRLMWRTEGRGERDREHIDELDVYQGVLRPGPSHFSFHFNLPDAPWSYAGHYIQIVWGIEVVLDVRWARDPKAFEPFILRAR